MFAMLSFWFAYLQKIWLGNSVSWFAQLQKTWLGSLTFGKHG
jgi:hypothetical protein